MERDRLNKMREDQIKKETLRQEEEEMKKMRVAVEGMKTGVSERVCGSKRALSSFRMLSHPPQMGKSAAKKLLNQCEGMLSKGTSKCHDAFSGVKVYSRERERMIPSLVFSGQVLRGNASARKTSVFLREQWRRVGRKREEKRDPG